LTWSCRDAVRKAVRERAGASRCGPQRALRGVALGRKNCLFAGSDAGGDRAAAIYSLIETAKLNGIDPQAYLADLLPYNWQPAS
jgi:IS66 C-terminal element